MKFSMIVPTWNEGGHIGSSLKRLREISDASAMELIIVDGGSKDKTVEVARPWADKVRLMDKPNRGAQLDAGAKLATGDLLFFLHADTQPPGNWQERLEKFWLASHPEPPAATVFCVDYGSQFRLVAAGQNLRARWFQVACGDQGFCTTADLYAKSGGFPHIALMEDIEFCRRLRALGRIAVLPERIWPSARRLRRRGALLNSLSNQFMVLRYKLGADPEKLWKGYYKKDLVELPPPPPAQDPEKHPFAYLRKGKPRPSA